MHQSRTMKSASFSLLLLILLGVAWCGDSHSWVGTEGMWVEGDLEEERMDPLSSNGKGVQGRKLRRIRHKGWM